MSGNRRNLQQIDGKSMSAKGLRPISTVLVHAREAAPSLRRMLNRAARFAGIHDVVGVERPLDRPHRVERRGAVLGQQILHLALSDPVLAGAGAVHGERPFDQPLAEPSRRATSSASVMSTSSVGGNCRRRHGRRSAPSSRLRDVALGLGDAFGQPRDRHADIGREAPARRAAAPRPPNRRRDAPATAGCAPPAASPIRTGRRRNPPRSRRSVRTARRRRPSVPWNSTNSIGVSGRSSLE